MRRAATAAASFDSAKTLMCNRPFSPPIYDYWIEKLKKTNYKTQWKLDTLPDGSRILLCLVTKCFVPVQIFCSRLKIELYLFGATPKIIVLAVKLNLLKFKSRLISLVRICNSIGILQEFLGHWFIFINCALLVKSLSLSGNTTHFLLVTTVTKVDFNKIFVQWVHCSGFSEPTERKTGKSHLCELVLVKTKRQTSRTRNL